MAAQELEVLKRRIERQEKEYTHTFKLNTLIRDQLSKTQDELNMAKANQNLNDIENQMSSQAHVAELN